MLVRYNLEVKIMNAYPAISFAVKNKTVLRFLITILSFVAVIYLAIQGIICRGGRHRRRRRARALLRSRPGVRDLTANLRNACTTTMSAISAPVSETVDVAIVGGGLSGLVTAVRASMAGLRAIVFETGAEERYLCASRLTGGVFHVCMTDIRTDPQKLAAIINEETGGFCFPELADLVAHNALRAVTWLTRAGVRFIRGPYPHLSFMLTPPNVVRVGAAWRGRGGDSALRVLEGQLVKCGGQIQRGHRARGLLSTPLGDCVGLEVESPQGISKVRASAVVLADGGFQSSIPALGRHVSPAPEKVFQRNARRSFGDAFEMAEVFAPAIAGMDSFYGHVLSRSALHNEKLWAVPVAGRYRDGGHHSRWAWTSVLRRGAWRGRRGESNRQADRSVVSDRDLRRENVGRERQEPGHSGQSLSPTTGRCRASGDRPHFVGSDGRSTEGLPRLQCRSV